MFLIVDIEIIFIIRDLAGMCITFPPIEFHRVSLKKLCGLSPRTNYTDRATAACRRS
jgi:hypothetical protein